MTDSIAGPNDTTLVVDDSIETHVCCKCSPDIALCGEDMTGEPWSDWNGHRTSCVVCDDLELQPCGKCGR